MANQGAPKHLPSSSSNGLERSTLALTSLPLPTPVAEHLLTLPRYRVPQELGDTPAGLGIVDGSYVLAVNDEVWPTLSAAQQAMIMLHEYGHLVYGHIPYAITHKLDPQLFNIAADAWLNNAYDPATVRATDGIRYEALRQQAPELPIVLPSPRIIYNVLMARGKERLGKLTAQDVLLMPDELSSEEQGKLSLQQLEAAASLRKALEDGTVPEALKKTLQNLAAGGGWTGSDQPFSSIGAPIPCAWLEQVLARLRGMSRHAAYRRYRGWYRPGRTDLLPGSTRRPGPLVVFGIDVSGSMSEHWPNLVATARTLASRYRVYVVIYADTILHAGPTVPTSPSVGGGTVYGPLWDIADSMKAALTINVTDGENADGRGRYPKSPVAWVYTAPAACHKLRKGDMKFSI